MRIKVQNYDLNKPKFYEKKNVKTNQDVILQKKSNIFKDKVEYLKKKNIQHSSKHKSNRLLKK